MIAKCPRLNLELKLNKEHHFAKFDTVEDNPPPINLILMRLYCPQSAFGVMQSDSAFFCFRGGGQKTIFSFEVTYE